MCPQSRAKRTEYTKPHRHTQPINCNFIPQKDTMIPYTAQTRHLLNSQVLELFPIVFYIFYIFYNLAQIRFQYIS